MCAFIDQVVRLEHASTGVMETIGTCAPRSREAAKRCVTWIHEHKVYMVNAVSARLILR